MIRRRRRRKIQDPDYELPLSMIDVIFLLLIFFMVCAKFKLFEKRLDANLPKDEGQQPQPKKVVPPDEIRIKIWMPSEGKINITVDEYACQDINALARKLAAFRAGDPNQAVIIDSRQRVPFKWVLAALDACQRAKMQKVKFQAPPVKGGGGSDWWYE